MLPTTLELITKTGDRLLQENMFDILTTAFPLELHLESLGKLFSALANFEDSVSLRNILCPLIERIARSGDSGPKTFEGIFHAAKNLLSSRKCSNLMDVLSIALALLPMAGTDSATQIFDLVSACLGRENIRG